MNIGNLALLANLAGEYAARATRAAAGALLAVEPSPEPDAPEINTSGVISFIATKITPILLAALGVIFISRAGKGEMSKVLTSSAIAILGLAFIAGATVLFFFGKGLVDLVFPDQ